MNIVPVIQPNHSAIALLVVILAVGCVGIFILLINVLNVWQLKRLSTIRFSAKKFREYAKAAEFTEEETSFLLDYLQGANIPRALEIFFAYSFSQSVMRQIFRMTYTEVDYWEEDIEVIRSYVFSMTQKFENYLQKNTFVKNTKKLNIGSHFYIDIDHENGGESRLVGKLRVNRNKYLEVQVLNGNLKSLVKGARATITIMKDGDRAIYQSRIRNIILGKRRRLNFLILEHSKRPEIHFGARRFLRLSLQVPVSTIPLRKLDDSYKSAGDEMINGLMADISMNGCGILSHVRLPKSSYIAVSYLNPYDNETIKLVCEIMGYGKLKNTQIDAVILQCRFVHVSPQHQNAIGAYVYEFEEEIDKIKRLSSGRQSGAVFDSKTASVLAGKSNPKPKNVNKSSA